LAVAQIAFSLFPLSGAARHVCELSFQVHRPGSIVFDAVENPLL
jgi:hypothetical protein